MTVDLFAHFPLRKGRTHESCGPGATGFALALAGQLGGAVMWVGASWNARALNPVGFSAFFDPQRLLLARPKTHSETLAVAEEALRGSGQNLGVMRCVFCLRRSAFRRGQRPL
ncbi:MAG: hypothetical protein WD046_13720 [Paracoccaceae bacterium]